MEFIETTVFTKKITDLISDESYKDFQRSLLLVPEQGRLIKDGAESERSDVIWRNEERAEAYG